MMSDIDHKGRDILNQTNIQKIALLTKQNLKISLTIFPQGYLPVGHWKAYAKQLLCAATALRYTLFRCVPHSAPNGDDGIRHNNHSTI